MSDKELIFEFINRLSMGGEKFLDISQDILRIPFRYSRLHFRNISSAFIKPHKFSPMSLTAPSTLFTLVKDYPDLPKSFLPRTLAEEKASHLVLREDLVKCLSNAYLYKGYVEKRLLDDLVSFMKGESRHLKVNWIKFNDHTRWTNSFPFKLPRFLEDIPESKHELNFLIYKHSLKIPLKNICILTSKEYFLLTATENDVYKRNAMYFLLLRELFENE